MNTSLSSSSISIRPLRADAVRRAAIAVLAALLALLTLGAMRPPVAAAASAPGTSTGSCRHRPLCGGAAAHHAPAQACS